jgi:NADPH:quinone reductase-like Zn-dependent oxidoreductase
LVAITRQKYGPPEVLFIKDWPIPKPKKNEIVVKTHYTTINRTDCGILRGKPYLIRAFTGLIKPSSPVPGTDFAGEIVEIGSEINRFKVGDRIWGLNDEGLGSQAEYFSIKDTQAIGIIPSNSNFDIVACAEGAHYALNFINKVKITSQSRVLVNGSTGGIGSAAVQILKHMGAHVIAVANTKNVDLVKSLGADEVIDYQTSDFTLRKEKFHFIFDAVGKSTFGKTKHMLEPKGTYISSELGPNAENLYLPLFTKLKGGKRVKFPIPRNCQSSIDYINELVKLGKFTPVIEKTYSPSEIQSAYTYVESGQKTGSVLLKF